MDYSLPGSPVHGSFQARVLEWVALAFSSGSSLVGLMVTSFKRLMPHPGLLHPEPCPCGSPLLTRTSTGDAQTQFCLSSCGVPGAWCTQGLFGPLSVVFILKAPQPTQAPDWLPVCDPACRTRTGSSEPSFPLETPHTCPVFSSVHTRSYLGKLFCF